MDPIPLTPPTSTLPVAPLPEPKSKIWLWIVAGVIILGTGVGGGVLLGKQLYTKPAPQPTPSSPVTSTCRCPDKTVCPNNDVGLCPEKLPNSSDPTADWKTYTNEKYGFSFRYPPQWIIQPVSAPNLDDQIWIASSGSRIPPGKYGGIGSGARPPISIIFSKQDLSSNYKEEQFSNFQSNTYVIDNITGVKKSGYNKEGLSQETIISVKMGNWYLNIIPLDVEESKQLDQILSTFKFLNDTEPSQKSSIRTIEYTSNPSWKTYTDTSSGFSIQYSEQYKIGSSTSGSYVNLLNCNDDPQRGEICLSGFTISHLTNYTGGSRREWLYKQNPNLSNFLINPYFEDVMVQGIKALIIMDRNTGGSTGSWVVIPKQPHAYVFTFPFGGGSDIQSGLNAIFQILSTFKFTSN